MCEAEEITAFAKQTILDMSERVLRQISRHYENVRQEVRSAMVGPVIETEARRILNEGMQQGRQLERQELLDSLVREGILTEEDAARRLNLSLEKFRAKLQRE